MPSVLVTGASRGIGAAIAHSLAGAGFRVAVHYNSSEEAARRVLGELSGSGHMLLRADISDASEAERLVQRSVDGLGGLDVLVNNAGVFEYHPVAGVGYRAWQEAWRMTLGTNLVAAANLSYCAARHMMSRGGGRIVNISSRGAFRGEPDAPAYGASKAGMNAMGQSLAQALAPHNVLVFTIAPGWVDTDMAAPTLDSPDGEAVKAQSPMRRVATAEEIARIALFCAQDAPAYMTAAIIDANGASYLRT
jgi:NAD(P)-dependent dehydrogenase (short-subunit alcohol dehydrogenase family)